MKNLINDYLDVVIIGGGPAGLSASLYLKRAGINTLIIEKEVIGGKVNYTNIIENFLMGQRISGLELGQRFKYQIEEMGINYKFNSVINIVKKNNLFKLVLNNEEEIYSKAVIIATGTKERRLKVLNESNLIHKGISYCGVCDGPLFKGKKIAVVGGGYSAIEESFFLSDLASEFFLIHRNENFRTPIEQVNRLKLKKNVNFLLNYTVEKVIGFEKLEKLTLKNRLNDKIIELEIDALFPYIGQTPSSEFIENSGILDKFGNVLVNKNFETNISGLFAAGDIIGRELKQISISVADGSICAQNVIKYLGKIL